MVNHNTPNKNRLESTEVTLSGNRSTFRDHLPSLANKTGAPMWVKKRCTNQKEQLELHQLQAKDTVTGILTTLARMQGKAKCLLSRDSLQTLPCLEIFVSFPPVFKLPKCSCHNSVSHCTCMYNTYRCRELNVVKH